MMLNSISIKTKLFFLPVLIITSFVIMYILMSYNLERFNDKAFKASQANKMIKNILKARIAEKNYNRRKDDTYVQELEGFLIENIKISQNLKDSFTQKDNKLLANKTKLLFEEYLKSFKKYQTIRAKSLQAEKDMIKEARDVEEFSILARSIQKKQRDILLKNNAHFDYIVDKIEKASLTNKIIKELNEIRIAEKNYIRRKNIKYKKIIDTKTTAIHKIITILKNDFQNIKNKEMMDEITSSLLEYKKTFDRFSALREESFTLSTNMKKYAREAEQLAINMRIDQKIERKSLESLFYTTMTSLFIIIGILMLIATLYIANTISRGINKILTTTLDVINGKDREEIEVISNDELGALAKSFNIMINKIDDHITNLDSTVDKKTKELKEKILFIEQTQNLLVENEKMAVLGSLVAGVAHEINTPIGNSYTSSTYILDELRHLQTKFNEESITKNNLKDFFDEGETLLTSVNINLERASRLIQSFKKIAVDSSTDHILDINLKQYTKDILISTKSLLKNTQITIELIIKDDVNVKINPGDYSQVVTNLIQNAVIHAFKKFKEGKIIITISQNDSIEISVCDDGLGIEKSNIDKIFNPFYTTNRNHGGSGLGLNIVYNIVSKSFNGTIKCTSELNKGTCFTIRIPM